MQKKNAHSGREDDSMFVLACRKGLLIQAEKMILCLSQHAEKGYLLRGAMILRLGYIAEKYYSRREDDYLLDLFCRNDLLTRRKRMILCLSYSTEKD